MEDDFKIRSVGEGSIIAKASSIIAKSLEEYANQKVPSAEELSDDLFNEVLPKISEHVAEIFKKHVGGMLEDQRNYEEGFEERLYERWQEPLDLLELLIRIAMEYGQNQKNKLDDITVDTNKYKFGALVKIHARACLVSNEILSLLKAGYADGANARWRTLYELAVVSSFLSKRDNDVSERYLDYDTVVRHKNVIHYQDYHKKLGYHPFTEEEIQEIKNERRRLCKQKYDMDFCEKKWGWIPNDVKSQQGKSQRGFTGLAKHVELDHWLPFYYLSSAALHGLSSGFYSLALINQDAYLLCGPSNYGLVDPLQNASISLYQITVALLNLRPDFESLVLMHTMESLVSEIGHKAVNIQKTIEKEESTCIHTSAKKNKHA